jgi:hypothetical protein
VTLALLPALLALLGTALLALAIFAPPAAPRPPVVSYAPPVTERAVERRTEPAWPRAIDARAVGCDASARLALVDALAAVRAPWAEAILTRALDDEPDAAVRAAIGEALLRRGDARRSA